MSVKFTDNSDKFIEEMHRKAEIALEAVGIHIEGEAKEELENSPRRIDTGLLRNSITHAVSGKAPAIGSYSGSNPSRFNPNGKIPHGSYSGNVPDDPPQKMAVYIGSNVQYAPYIHEGSTRLTPNRFLKNACVKNQAQIREYIEKEMKG